MVDIDSKFKNKSPSSHGQFYLLSSILTRSHSLKHSLIRFMIYIDDTASHNPTRLLHFQQTLLFPTSPSTSPFSSSTSSHSDPILHHFALHLNNMYTFYNPISANCIITATLEFITGCVLETQNNITTMPLHRPTMTGHQNLYPYYLRSKTGVAPAYAFMMFPKEENPNMEVYLEVIPELCLFIDKTNDVLSYVPHSHSAYVTSPD